MTGLSITEAAAALNVSIRRFHGLAFRAGVKVKGQRGRRTNISRKQFTKIAQRFKDETDGQAPAPKRGNPRVARMLTRHCSGGCGKLITRPRYKMMNRTNVYCHNCLKIAREGFRQKALESIREKSKKAIIALIRKRHIFVKACLYLEAYRERGISISQWEVAKRVGFRGRPSPEVRELITEAAERLGMKVHEVKPNTIMYK